MNLNYLAFAVPLFLFFIGLEFIMARRRKLPYFHLHDSIANLSIGIAERLLDVFVTGIFFFVYDYIHKNFGFFEINPNVFLWILLLLITDFLWYWYHRLAHEINVFWAVHVVHHQSEDFNYTVATRITVFQAFIRTGFWCVLPFIGFPASMITSVLLFHGLYPFFTHTRLIGKLGLLEYLLVTPSHHRVHHASNERYLDKNYGDVFIIWDKLFGTFVKEDEKDDIKYGLTEPLKSFSFLWQHFHFFAELFITLKSTKGLKNKFKLIFGKPDDIPSVARLKAEDLFQISKKKHIQNKPLNKYVIVQMIFIIIALFVFLLFEHNINWPIQTMITLIILLTLINCGAIMEQKRWIYYLEFSRVLLIGLCVVYAFPNLYLNVAISIITLLIIHYFESLRFYYFKWMYAD